MNEGALERLRLKLLQEPGAVGEWPQAAVLVALADARLRMSL